MPIEENRELFSNLFHIFLWPIIQPLIQSFAAQERQKIHEIALELFFNKIAAKAKETTKTKTKLEELFTATAAEKTEVLVFIFNLLDDFTRTFMEDVIAKKSHKEALEEVSSLINFELATMWADKIVQQTITPILLFSLKSQKKIIEVQQLLTRVFLAVLQEDVSTEEAAQQVAIILINDYKVSEEAAAYVKAIVRTIGTFQEKEGLEALAKLAKEAQIETKQPFDFRKVGKNIGEAVKDTVYEREKLIAEWTKNILRPASIGLHIAGKKKYNEFIKQCQTNFELFLDKKLSAEDFEKRLTEDLKNLGGEEEELFRPILDSIASSVKILEIARIDDPSFSFLLMISEDLMEESKRFYT